MDYYSDRDRPDSPVLSDAMVQLAARLVDQHVDADEMNIILFWEHDEQSDYSDDEDADNLGDMDGYSEVYATPVESDNDSESDAEMGMETESETEADPGSHSSTSGESAGSSDGDESADSSETESEVPTIILEPVRFLPPLRPRTLAQWIHSLGFTSTDSFLDFIHSPGVSAIFQELWDDWLYALPATHELPVRTASHDPAAIIAHGIDRSWAGEPSARCYEADRPDKTGWTVYDHMTRYALKLGPLCDAGQLRGLRECRRSLVWARAALVLVRGLRSMQKGFPGRSLYLRVAAARRQREEEA